MISFIAYFSTAQEEDGFVVMQGDGSAPAEFTGGAAIEEGVYRLEGEGLVRVDVPGEVADTGAQRNEAVPGFGLVPLA